MGLFSMKSLALKWSYLFFGSGLIVFIEYFNLYVKQLGLSPSQIGFTSLFGVLYLSLPLVGFLGDRFRARKLIFTVSTAVGFLTTLAPLLPLVVSLPTCFLDESGEPPINQASHLSKEYLQGIDVSFNRSSNSFLFPSAKKSNSRFSSTFPVDKIPTPVKKQKRNTNVPWLSTLFTFMAIARALVTLMETVVLSLQNLATLTYLKEKKSSYGSYFMWAHIGASVSLFGVGLLASHLRITICGVTGDGYFVTFFWAGAAIMLSSFAFPSFKYEYLEHRVIKWTEVKSVLFDIHYVFMLIFSLFFGCCIAFQFYWEFWYISELSGSPIIMGKAGLIRRPLVGLWFYLSGHLIEKVGDLKTIAVALFLFSVSFFAISFISIPWLVLIIDLLEAAAYGFSYTALTVHFSKCGSKASSFVIFGK